MNDADWMKKWKRKKGIGCVQVLGWLAVLAVWLA